MRILESENFIPESVNLLLAVFFGFVQGFEFIKAFAASKNGLEQFPDRIIFKGLLFPGEVRVKESKGSGKVNYFIGERD